MYTPTMTLQDARKRKQWTQLALAFAAGMEPSTISRLETGAAPNPTHDTVRKLEIALGLTRSGAAAGLVTGPVSKAQLYAIGFNHAGQTEFVAERCGVSDELVAMMLLGPTLRTVPVTVHLAFRAVPDALTTHDMEFSPLKNDGLIEDVRRKIDEF